MKARSIISNWAAVMPSPHLGTWFWKISICNVSFGIEQFVANGKSTNFCLICQPAFNAWQKILNLVVNNRVCKIVERCRLRVNIILHSRARQTKSRSLIDSFDWDAAICAIHCYSIGHDELRTMINVTRREFIIKQTRTFVDHCSLVSRERGSE